MNRAGMALMLVVGLALGAVLRQYWPLDLMPSDDISSSVDREHEEISSAVGVRNTYASLQRAGLSDAASKSSVLAVLQGAQRPEVTPYWLPAASDSAAAFERRGHTRSLILEAFGSGAAEDPAFADVFRPYDPELAFLSSAKQLKLEELERSANAAAVEDSSGPVDLASAINREQRRAEAFATAVRELLSPAEFFEFQVRRSPFAQRLRTNRLDLSETEFRAILERAAANDALLVRTSTSELLRNSEALSVSLGARRALEFSRQQDPAYTMIGSVARANGSPPRDVDRAYDIVVAARDQVAKLSPSADTATRARQIADVSRSRDKQLASVLGESAARQMSRSLDVFQNPRDLSPAAALLPNR